MFNDDKKEKGYIEFLESMLEASNADLQITQTSFDYRGPQEEIVKWKGSGDLPIEKDDPEMADLVKRITAPGEHLGGQQDEGGIKKENPKAVLESDEDEMDESPLSILEELRELEEDEDAHIPEDFNDDSELTEDLDFTEEEGEIITRLIGEMDELDFEENFDEDLLEADLDSYETMEDDDSEELSGSFDVDDDDLTDEDSGSPLDDLDDDEDALV